MPKDLLYAVNKGDVVKAASTFYLRLNKIERDYPLQIWREHLAWLGEAIYIPKGPFLIGIREDQLVPLLENLKAAVPLPDTLRSGKSKIDRASCEVQLSAFYIDRYPVTNLQFHNFVKETNYFPLGAWIIYYCHPLEPATGLTSEDIFSYCEWSNKRLPTENEWEKACRGTGGRLWPWGDEPNPARCNCQEFGIEQLTPVNKFNTPSPYGCYDMAGNVWEITNSIFLEDDEFLLPVMKGGAFSTLLGNCRASFRITCDASTQWDRVGFRCVRCW